MSCSDIVIGLCFLAFLCAPAILQGLGLNGNKWIEDSNCSALDNKPSCCQNTMDNSSSCGHFKVEDLDHVAYKLHGVAFWILLTPLICFLLEAFCSSNDDEHIGICSLIGGFCFLLYPVAGLLSFIGCMKIVGKYSGHTFGASFNYCLASGLYVIIITAMLFTWACLKRKRKAAARHAERSAVQSYETSGSAAPYGGGPQFAITEATVERTAVVHDSEHGGFYLFMARVNVIHAVLH